MTLVRRSPSVPAVATNYAEYKHPLRHDFWYSCAYCTMTELEATGVGFQIDHYEAQTTHPHLEHTYSNLLWACEHCNNVKRAHPTDNARKQGYEIFRPDVHDAHDHFSLKHNSLEGKTKTIGTYSIRTLRLNSGAKRKLRQLRRDISATREHLLEGIRALASIKIDQLPEEVRTRYEKARKKVKGLSSAAGEMRAEVLHELARSPMLDDDPDAKAEKRDRLKYLKSIDAFVPEE